MTNERERRNDDLQLGAGRTPAPTLMNTHCATESIDLLVARFFSAFDNRNGATPLLSNVIDCFSGKATIARHSSSGAELLSVNDFAIPRIELLTKGALLDFHEWETGASTQVFGGIATRTSRYSKAGLLNGEQYSGSGTKCFQFVDLGAHWRITALVWSDDNA